MCVCVFLIAAQRFSDTIFKVHDEGSHFTGEEKADENESAAIKLCMYLIDWLLNAKAHKPLTNEN